MAERPEGENLLDLLDRLRISVEGDRTQLATYLELLITAARSCGEPFDGTVSLSEGDLLLLEKVPLEVALPLSPWEDEVRTDSTARDDAPSTGQTAGGSASASASASASSSSSSLRRSRNRMRTGRKKIRSRSRGLHPSLT